MTTIYGNVALRGLTVAEFERLPKGKYRANPDDTVSRLYRPGDEDFHCDLLCAELGGPCICCCDLRNDMETGEFRQIHTCMACGSSSVACVDFAPGVVP